MSFTINLHYTEAIELGRLLNNRLSVLEDRLMSHPTGTGKRHAKLQLHVQRLSKVLEAVIAYIESYRTKEITS